MCQALYSLGCKIDFQLTVENIYDQPLFCNPKIVLYDKTIIWYDFIRAGIVTIKDICYEVKTGFLPKNAIVDMINNVCDYVNIQYVIDRYHCLLSIIPDEWNNTIHNNVHHRNIDRTIDISVLIKNVPCDLKSCNVKKLYQCVLEDITEEPIGPIIWKKLYALDEAKLCKI
ncbi:unnamed protein product [Mytilus coruscus]|uniref:Uncharacterized protein n=1 Tax=Mytilus coruscus TaxID=42192 RepID=A0A6J8A4S1_MYTCO|nr:unnamed protein product [Mytilus coruscus]